MGSRFGGLIYLLWWPFRLLFKGFLSGRSNRPYQAGFPCVPPRFNRVRSSSTNQWCLHHKFIKTLVWFL